MQAFAANVNSGTWTLTEVGSYGEKSTFSPAPTSFLDGIADIVADNYGLDEDGKNGLIVHKLTDANDDLVGYGLVIATDETNGYALFIADLWNRSGAGYILSNSEITENSVTFNTDKLVQSTYSVSVSPESNEIKTKRPFPIMNRFIPETVFLPYKCEALHLG